MNLIYDVHFLQYLEDLKSSVTLPLKLVVICALLMIREFFQIVSCIIRMDKLITPVYLIIMWKMASV